MDFLRSANYTKDVNEFDVNPVNNGFEVLLLPLQLGVKMERIENNELKICVGFIIYSAILSLRFHARFMI